jgi:hypothetical protein
VVVEAGTDGRVNATIECYNCHKYGHIAGNCPTKKSKAQSNPKANAAESGGDGGGGAEAQPQANAAVSYDIEVDDDWDEGGESACVYTTDAETLDLLAKAGGSPPQR